VHFFRKKSYSRTETLAAADLARAKGRRKRAIAGYRRVLAEDPNDTTVHGKVAPLLAQTGDRGDALASFRRAADGHLRAGFVDRGLAMLSQAVAFFPEETGLWEEIARLHVQRGRRADAVAALVTGGGRLEKVRRRPAAIRILRGALELEPWQPEATLGLARVLAASGEKEEGLALLGGLAARVRGPLLRRVLAQTFRLSPTPRNLWRWLRGRR
jgi:tetratricopeptide (TPR) repeat protein